MKALLKKDFGEKRKLASKTESSFRRAFFEKEASGRKKKLWRKTKVGKLK